MTRGVIVSAYSGLYLHALVYGYWRPLSVRQELNQSRLKPLASPRASNDSGSAVIW